MSLKERIICESLRLISLKGYLNTSLDDILSAAQASKGGLYNHFGSKEALFEEVLAQARRIWRAQVLDGVASQPTHMDQVRRLVDNYLHRYLPDSQNIPGGCIFVSLSTELDDQHPRFAAMLRQGFHGVRRLITDMLARAQEAGELRAEVEVEALGHMLFSCMIGASVLYSMEKSEQDLERAVRPMLNYLDSLAV